MVKVLLRRLIALTVVTAVAALTLTIATTQTRDGDAFADTNPTPSIPASSHPTASKHTSRKPVATFGTQTASKGVPDGRGLYVFAATVGGQIQDEIALINYSLQPITLTVKPDDAVNTVQGGFAALPVNQKPREVGTWITIPPKDRNVAIPARSSVIVPFTVQVPPQATPGDHFGVITATLSSAAISKSGQRFQLLQTVGTRVFLRVSGPLRPGLTITNLNVFYRGTLDPAGSGSSVITYRVTNSGNVALGGAQQVSVSGLFGSKRTAQHLSRIQLLLPGFSVNERVTVSGVIPEIRDSAKVSISPLYIAGTTQPASGPYVATVTFWAVPWVVAGIVVAILIVIVLLIVRRRRRSRPVKGSEPKPPSGPSTDEVAPPVVAATAKEQVDVS